MNLIGLSEEKSILIANILRSFSNEFQKEGSKQKDWLKAIEKGAGDHKNDPQVQYLKFCICGGDPLGVQEMVNAARQGHVGAQLNCLRGAGVGHRLDVMSDLKTEDLRSFEPALTKVYSFPEGIKRSLIEYSIDYNSSEQFRKTIEIKQTSEDFEEFDESYYKGFCSMISSHNHFDSYSAAKNLFSAIKDKPKKSVFKDIWNREIYLLNTEDKYYHGLTYKFSLNCPLKSSSSRRALLDGFDLLEVFENCLFKSQYVSELAKCIFRSFYPFDLYRGIPKAQEFLDFVAENFTFIDHYTIEEIKTIIEEEPSE